MEIQYALNMPSNRLHTLAPWKALTDPDTLRLARPTAADRLAVPAAVEFKKEAFYFRWGEPRLVPVPADLLERFVSARDDVALFRFAKRWGPLGIDCYAHGCRINVLLTRPSRTEHMEAVRSWRYFRRQFNALLGLASGLKDNDGLSFQYAIFERLDWTGTALDAAAIGGMVSRWDKWKQHPRLPATQRRLMAEQPRRVAIWALDFWTARLVAACGLHPALRFDEERKASHVALVFQDARSAQSSAWGLALISALTLQLVSAVSGTGFASCSECGEVFKPSRRPAQGRRRFCQECRDGGAAVRAAKAAWRGRERQRATRRR